MQSYSICTQDGLVFVATSTLEAHLTANPTHFAILGWNGDTGVPTNPVVTNTRTEVSSLAEATQLGLAAFVLALGKVGSPGLAMGMMGTTYSRSEVDTYDLYYTAANGDLKKVRLT